MPNSSQEHRKPSLMHPKQAIEQLLTQVSVVQETETIALPQALGRVLATDVHSLIDLPPFDNSAMDGYAFRFADLEAGKPLQLNGFVFAGHPFTGEYQANSCVRIMTGAAVPACYDTVQMQELTRAEGEQVYIEAPERAGMHIRCRAEELAAGHHVLSAGTKIGAAEMGVLATLGIAEVTVYRQLTVAFFSTGDELRPVGTALQEGEIYDSNRYAILGLLQKAGVNWLDLGVIEDDPEALRAAFKEAASRSDMVITSGGVSVGDADYTKQILEEEGQITFWKMAIKPGKPFAFGRLGDAVFSGLPGNPVSSMVTFYKIVLPLLQKMQGLAVTPALTVKAKLTHDLRKDAGRVEYQRAILTRDENGELQVATTGSQGSGMLTSMSLANSFIVLAQEQTSVTAGDWVEVEPFTDVLA